MKKYLIGIAALAAFITIVIAIFPTKTPPQNKTNDVVDFNGAIEPSDPLPWWFGEYTYSEFAKPNITLTYSLRLALPNGSPRAILNIDGFQTMSRLLADVKEVNEDTVQLIFDNYQVGDAVFEEGRVKTLAHGDILLTLKKTQNGNLQIKWGKIQSGLINPGLVEFEKVKP
jgi:hypothetical protein